jgi:hypothetical protein
MQRIVGKRAHRKGRSVGAPDDHGAGPFEVGDNRAVFARDHVAIGDDAIVGRIADLVSIDLGRDRYAVQWTQSIPLRPRLVGSVRGG